MAKLRRAQLSNIVTACGCSGLNIWSTEPCILPVAEILTLSVGCSRHLIDTGTITL